MQNSNLLPSEVNSRPWLYVSQVHKSNSNSDNKAVGDSEDTCTIGKWLLFHKTKVEDGERMSAQDLAWQSIHYLVTDSRNTDVISAKASTNWQDGYAGGATSNGVVCCYTADYRDKASVKRAADSIRSFHPYPCDMYYKTDEATYAGAYRNQGNKDVSISKHSVEGQLYERDQNSKWILVEL